MDSFWKWLMRANARGVFLGSLLGFLLAIGWWTYREYRPEKGERIPGTDRTIELNTSALGISAFIDDQLEAFRKVTRGNPFEVFQPQRPPTPQPHPEPKPQPVVAKPPPPPPKPSAPAAEPVAIPKERYTIEYKGLFTRSDGRTVALLRDGKTGDSTFYGKGAPLRDMTVGRITQNQVSIVCKDGSLALLKLGEPQEF